MSDFLKVYCRWDKSSLLHFHDADLVVLRRYLAGSNWWTDLSLTSLAVRIFDNLPLGQD